ncbi:MAG: sulfite exporter TauE/SafE family protein [Roseibium album]|uniref:Probable membrane transporter protein n=1 Tax=Roseibium album TaxID=311410 RepID=A0A0M6ZNU0_9HYPH|nr:MULTISPECIES: sulfite exporter TauE/SafE family protein [Stappiaceae]MBG6146281.1 putative membrane protein YfcA [Labrenzia sp. EL_142]MBG6154860.1 putative membrane protein YfcA [Labrenzia sp. EL_162]MBG6162118.1 putative membrane protein YfcA [Labrenzia sp. EL_195]MBG6174164.1 putative membrane protein YfcA [Labrenzia sp. EL_132]MBG6193010.1 putative membrane protein YfcA [Labrenzia sp. EL_159]MBG6199397.1 putative membrane protein YfcA [Labrenzia sp. EL_13]MBG6228380.1 putative membran
MDDLSLFSLSLLALSLVATGVVAGIIAGLLGVGGGIVIVPVLYYMFTALKIDPDVLMHVAVGTSLATILATGASSARAHYKRGSVDMDLLKRWWWAIALGVLAGATLAGNISGGALTFVFGVVALAVAANMMLRKEGSHLADKLPGSPIREVLGFLIGGISVMMGIGGGTLGVPTLTLFNYPIRKAVGTAAAIGLIIAVPGTLLSVYFGFDLDGRPPLSLGYVNLIGFMLIIPASTLTAPLGAKIAHAIDPAKLKLVFALFLGFTGLRMIYGVFF